jgi:hypothetical protein
MYRDQDGSVRISIIQPPSRIVKVSDTHRSISPSSHGIRPGVAGVLYLSYPTRWLLVKSLVAHILKVESVHAVVG